MQRINEKKYEGKELTEENTVGSFFVFWEKDMCKRKGEKMEEFQVIENYLMVKLPEEVDHHRAAYICQNADRYIVQENVSNVVFDFEDTRFMDSSGIGIIMGRYKKISCFGGRVYAIHADRQIMRILKMSGLNQIVEVLT